MEQLHEVDDVGTRRVVDVNEPFKKKERKKKEEQRRRRWVQIAGFRLQPFHKDFDDTPNDGWTVATRSLYPGWC